LIVLFAHDAEDVNRAFVYGMVVLQGEQVAPRLVDPMRQYAALRRQIREKKAPGYPYGFGDDRGLSALPDAMVAKVFSDSRGITVAYYAKEAVATELRVDGRALGHPRIGLQRRALKLGAEQAGYFILE
jgi:hypothetical protein